MPIFGAKSRAARGCASKLACGRRIDPHGARPFLRYVAANLPLPQWADRGVRPYRTFYVFAENACNFAIAFFRVDVGIDPYGHITLLPHIVRFCNCVLRGRGKPRPYITTKWVTSPKSPYKTTKTPRGAFILSILLISV